jgi:hypothetical protein
MVHLVPIPYERECRLALTLFRQYMFSGGCNSVREPLPTTLYDVKTTIYRTSSCYHMVYLVPIPQECASRLVLELFGWYMCSRTRNSVMNPLTTTTGWQQHFLLHQNNNLPDQLMTPHGLSCSNTIRTCFPPGLGNVWPVLLQRWSHSNRLAITLFTTSKQLPTRPDHATTW